MASATERRASRSVILAVIRSAKRSTAAAASSSLPPGKWKYIEPLGASASDITWFKPVAA